MGSVFGGAFCGENHPTCDIFKISIFFFLIFPLFIYFFVLDSRHMYTDVLSYIAVFPFHLYGHAICIYHPTHTHSSFFSPYDKLCLTHILHLG